MIVKHINNLVIMQNGEGIYEAKLSGYGTVIFRSGNLNTIISSCKNCKQFLKTHPIKFTTNEGIEYTLTFKPINERDGVVEHFCEVKFTDKYNLTILTQTAGLHPVECHYVTILKKGTMVINQQVTKTKEDSEIVALVKQVCTNLAKDNITLICKTNNEKDKVEGKAEKDKAAAVYLERDIKLTLQLLKNIKGNDLEGKLLRLVKATDYFKKPKTAAMAERFERVSELTGVVFNKSNELNNLLDGLLKEASAAEGGNRKAELSNATPRGVFKEYLDSTGEKYKEGTLDDLIDEYMDLQAWGDDGMKMLTGNTYAEMSSWIRHKNLDIYVEE